MIHIPHTEAEAALAAGHDYRAQGDLAGAERAFLLATTRFPNNAETHGALGDLRIAQGRFTGAVTALTRANALDPGRPHRLAALAEALSGAGEPAEAAAMCRNWLLIRPDSVPALLALAEALQLLEDAAGAVAALREAVMLATENAESATRLCHLLTTLGQPLEALELAQPALRHSPDHPPLHLALGLAWRALGEREKALQAFRHCLALDPTDAAGARGALFAPINPHETAAPDPGYVRALFDRYAVKFDTDLVGKLGYCGPQLLRAALGPTPGDRDILDLGCGTGLAGAEFAPLARHLAGCDLAPRMVDQARLRGIYHQLSVEDLTVCLNRAPLRWDLILAADVLNYLGDLEPMMRAVAAALRHNGRLLATVESAPDLEGFEFMASRRVRHGAAHIDLCAKAAGLTLTHQSTATLRTEKRQPVACLVLVIEKKG